MPTDQNNVCGLASTNGRTAHVGRQPPIDRQVAVVPRVQRWLASGAARHKLAHDRRRTDKRTYRRHRL